MIIQTFLILSLTLGACTKDHIEAINEAVDSTGSTELYFGNFMSGVHTTSGKVSVL